MKNTFTLLLLASFITNLFAVEITEDNPTTLVDLKPTDYTLYGIKLGTKLDSIIDTEKPTKKNSYTKSVKSEFAKKIQVMQNPFNPSEYYIYNTGEGMRIATLTIENNEVNRMHFERHAVLSKTFRRLTSVEVIKESDKIIELIGYPDSSAIDIDRDFLGDTKTTTFTYSECGLFVQEKAERNTSYTFYIKK